MTNDELLQAAAALLAPWTISTRAPEANRLDVLMHVTDLLPAAQVLRDAHWGYLVALTALDYAGKPNPFAQDERYVRLVQAGAVAADAPVMELLYFYSAGPVLVTLRMLITRESPTIPSVCGIIPSASFFERELSEMFGITVQNTPDPRKLFLPDDWAAGSYPLRKDFVQATE